MWAARLLLAAIVSVLTSSSLAAEDKGCGRKITVARGDTLSALARRCGVDPAALVRANPAITDPNVIPLGANLKVPNNEQAPPASQEALSRENSRTPSDRVRIEPPRAPPGSRVTLTASGLPPRSRVWVKGGWRRTGHLILRSGRTDAAGRFAARVRLPSWASAGQPPEQYLFSVEIPRTGETIRGAPVRVIAPGGDALKTDRAGSLSR